MRRRAERTAVRRPAVPEVRAPSRPGGGAARLLELQRTVGNRAVAATLTRRPAVQRACCTGCATGDGCAGGEREDAGPTVSRLPADGATPQADLSSPRFAGVAVLEACFDDTARLGVGARGDAVERVQQALVDLGFDLGPGGNDGVYGERTAAAVRQFKTVHGLGSTQFGDVGPGTMRRLDQLFPGGPAPRPEQTVDVESGGEEETGSCPSGPDITTALAADSPPPATSALVGAPGVGAVHKTILQAIGAFTGKLDIPGRGTKPNLVETGQFFWSGEVRTVVDAEIARIEREPGSAAFVSRARAFLTGVDDRLKPKEKDALFDKVAEEAAKATSPAKAAMKSLLATGATADGGTLELDLWAKLNKSNSMPSVLHLRSLKAYRTLAVFDLTACGFHVARVAERVNAGGGMSGTPKGPSVSADLVGGSTKRDRREFSSGTRRCFGDVFPQTGLSSAVTKLKDALDNGHMVHARVLSGVGAGKGCIPGFDPPGTKVTDLGPPPEEHSILIIGFDGDEFVFHDADATVSRTPMAGFGSLFFKDGRLSTADGAGDLPVTRCGNHPRGDKRYQVIKLRPV